MQKDCGGGKHNVGAKHPVFAPRMDENHNEGAKDPVFAPRMGVRRNRFFADAQNDKGASRSIRYAFVSLFLKPKD